MKVSPPFAAADFLNNLIDICHSYLAEHLQMLVECDPYLVYNSIQPSNTNENGDLDGVRTPYGEATKAVLKAAPPGAHPAPIRHREEIETAT
jgi:hypothetical protein